MLVREGQKGNFLLFAAMKILIMSYKLRHLAWGGVNEVRQNTDILKYVLKSKTLSKCTSYSFNFIFIVRFSICSNSFPKNNSVLAALSFYYLHLLISVFEGMWCKCDKNGQEPEG